jgi:DNA-binding response OmpR family regulator
MNVLLLSTDRSLLQVVRDAADCDSHMLQLRHFEAGNEAVGALVNPNEAKPELAIVDITSTPDGARFIDFVKSSGHTSFIPVIALTDQMESLPAIFSKRIGAMHILQKPVTATDIAKIIAVLRMPGAQSTPARAASVGHK